MASYINGTKCDTDPRVVTALQQRPACFLERWWSTYRFTTGGTGIYTAPNNECFTAKLNDSATQGFPAGFSLDYPETNMELQGQLQYDALVRQLGVRLELVTPGLYDVLDFTDNLSRNMSISFRKNKKSDNFIGGLKDFLRGPDMARSLAANLAAPGSRSVGWSTKDGNHDLCVPIRVGKAETFSVKFYLPRGLDVGVAAVHTWQLTATIGVQNLEDM